MSPTNVSYHCGLFGILNSKLHYSCAEAVNVWTVSLKVTRGLQEGVVGLVYNTMWWSFIGLPHGMVIPVVIPVVYHTRGDQDSDSTWVPWHFKSLCLIIYSGEQQRKHQSPQLTGAFLWWRHNGRDGVSNHQRLDGLLKRLFRCRSKKTSKLRVIGLCEGNSPVTGEFPSQKASDGRNVSIDEVIMVFEWTPMSTGR